MWLKYIMSALINGHLVIDTKYARSDKQAWYFFCKENGYANRDFKVLHKEAV